MASRSNLTVPRPLGIQYSIVLFKLCTYTFNKYKMGPPMTWALLRTLPYTVRQSARRSTLDNRTLVDEFLETGEGKALLSEEREIARAIRDALEDSFLVLEHTSRGTMLMDTTGKVYCIAGLEDSVQAALSSRALEKLPIGMMTSILPLGNQIVYDSMMVGLTKDECDRLPQFKGYTSKYAEAKINGTIVFTTTRKQLRAQQKVVNKAHQTNFVTEVETRIASSVPGPININSCSKGLERNTFTSVVCVTLVIRVLPDREFGERSEMTEHLPIGKDTDPCMCGSGKTFENCHKNASSLPMIVRNYPGDEYAVGKDLSKPMDIQWTFSEAAPQEAVFRVKGDILVVKYRLDYYPALDSDYSDLVKTRYMLLGFVPVMHRNMGCVIFGDIELRHSENKLVVSALSYQRMKRLLKLLREDLGLTDLLEPIEAIAEQPTVISKTTGEVVRQTNTRYTEGLQRQVEKFDEECAVCNRKAGFGVVLKKCSACKGVSYCGRECQTIDWKSHKKQCKAASDSK